MAKNTQAEDEKLEVVGETLSKTEKFVNENKKTIIGVLVAIALIVVAFFAYKHLYKLPHENEAQFQMASAERAFAADSFKVALLGDGDNLGFNQIIEDYGSTKAGKIARFYAGICNLRLGNYQQAIDNLKEYTPGDEIIGARALCGIGDAYVQLEQYDQAADYFEKAANYKDNNFAAAYLMKAALVYEKLGKTDKVIETYKKVRDNYPNTIEAQEVVKYIERAEITKQ